MGNGTNQLLTCLKPVLNPSVRFFCFPYAGGGASAFADWGAYLPNEIEYLVLRLPGRETRINEPPFLHLPDLLDELIKGIGPYLDLPFVFFGHSMGALVSFELVRLLRQKRFPQPVHFFASSFRAPQLPDADPPMHKLTDYDFIRELKNLGGTPKEIFEHPELLDLLLPVIRADISICQTYIYKKEKPLNCSISAYSGINDKKLNRLQMEGWQYQTTGSFELKFFMGDHFFYHESKMLLLETISKKLNEIKTLLYE